MVACAQMWRFVVVSMLAAAQQIPSLTIAGDADAARLLQLSVSDIALLRSRGVLATEVPRPKVPEAFDTFPIPQSVPENAEARSELRARGSNERDIHIGESVGAWMAADNGFWFGKSFYSGEGERGHGGVGFLSKDGKYTMLEVPALRRWSVSGLLVEPDAIWAGMFRFGELANSSQGLLRYDRNTKRSRIFLVPGIIHTLLRLRNDLFIGTDQGPYVLLRDGKLTRLLWK